MDKLRPILKQKYWICFGLALVFVLVGWWMASDALAVKIDERRNSVKASFTEAVKGDTEPNELWVAGGKKKNDEDALAYQRASLQLWKRQQTAREWPEQIRSKMQEIGYFAEVPLNETRERWASIYQRQIEELLKLANPFQYDTGEGLVVVDASRVTHQPYDNWRIDRPTSNEIWSNQEDIWLLKAILTSIAKTNDAASSIRESQIREIKRLHLRGGDRNTTPGASVGQGGPASMMMGGAAFGGRKGEESGSGGTAGVAARGSLVHPGTQFIGASGGDILTEEFGSVGGPSGMAAASFQGDDDRGKGSGRAAGGSIALAPEVRYVDGGEKDLGYKTRAFLLDVVIQDERLPDLLAKLTNSDFPVEIVRVEVTSNVLAMGRPMTGYTPDAGSRGGFGSRAGGFGGIPAFGGNSGRGKKDDEDGFTSGSGGMLAGTAAAKASEVLNAAMSDPMLIEVHIGGLLTLYMTPEETEMQAKTEEADAKETANEALGSEATNNAGVSANPDATSIGPDSQSVDPVHDSVVPDASEAEFDSDVGAPGPTTEQPEAGGAESTDAPAP